MTISLAPFVVIWFGLMCHRTSTSMRDTCVVRYRLIKESTCHEVPLHRQMRFVFVRSISLTPKDGSTCRRCARLQSTTYISLAVKAVRASRFVRHTWLRWQVVPCVMSTRTIIFMFLKVVTTLQAIWKRQTRRGQARHCKPSWIVPLPAPTNTTQHPVHCRYNVMLVDCRLYYRVQVKLTRMHLPSRFADTQKTGTSTKSLKYATNDLLLWIPSRTGLMVHKSRIVSF